jgi:predicted nucleotidyltransferase
VESSADTRSELEVRVGEALAPLEEVRLVYLFGSQVTGGSSSRSDLDVAIHFDPGLDEASRARTKLRVIAVLTDTLGPVGERVDIVDLARASSAVAFRAIRDGVCVLTRDERERVRLEAYVARRYDDERPHRALFRDAARRVARQMRGA